jgi:hypothetical protein
VAPPSGLARGDTADIRPFPMRGLRTAAD